MKLMSEPVKENSYTRVVFRILFTPTLISVALLLLYIGLSYFISKGSTRHISIGFPDTFYKTTSTSPGNEYRWWQGVLIFIFDSITIWTLSIAGYFLWILKFHKNK
jgi:hypothetical protein